MRLIRTQVIILHAVCCLAILLNALPADAQLVQVPNLSGFGNTSHINPFGFLEPRRYQQIYASSAFPHGGIIDKIMFRNDEQIGSTYAPTTIDVQVAFAYAARSPSIASHIFAHNIGDDFTIVLDDIITESYAGPLADPAFDFVVDVANTFTYDPLRGDLLMQVLTRNSPGFVLTQFDTVSDRQSTVTNSISGNGIDAQLGLVGTGDGQRVGVVTQFEFIPVPEPSAVAQFGAMLLLMIARRRRHE